ncbi:MAG TPA: hypothetical protein VIP98_10835, partial [Microlunatus sp.]
PAHTIGGFRLNDYVSAAAFLAALICFLWLVKNKPGREEIVEGDFRYVNGLPPEQPSVDAAEASDEPVSSAVTSASPDGGDEPDQPADPERPPSS